MLGEILTAAVTPFDPEGNVSLDRFRDLCRFLVVKPMQVMQARRARNEEVAISDEERRHQELLEAIRGLDRR